MQLSAPQAVTLLFIVLPVIWYAGFPRHAYRRRRDISSLLLRSIIVALIVLALAGLQNVQAVERLAVVFLVDASDSMGGGAEDEQLAYIREAIANKSPDDVWAAVLFGDNAIPETDFQRGGRAGRFLRHPDNERDGHRQWHSDGAFDVPAGRGAADRATERRGRHRRRCPEAGAASGCLRYRNQLRALCAGGGAGCAHHFAGRSRTGGGKIRASTYPSASTPREPRQPRC